MPCALRPRAALNLTGIQGEYSPTLRINFSEPTANRAMFLATSGRFQNPRAVRCPNWQRVDLLDREYRSAAQNHCVQSARGPHLRETYRRCAESCRGRTFPGCPSSQEHTFQKAELRETFLVGKSQAHE